MSHKVQRSNAIFWSLDITFLAPHIAVSSCRSCLEGKKFPIANLGQANLFVSHKTGCHIETIFLNIYSFIRYHTIHLCICPSEKWTLFLLSTKSPWYEIRVSLIRWRKINRFLCTCIICKRLDISQKENPRPQSNQLTPKMCTSLHLIFCNKSAHIHKFTWNFIQFCVVFWRKSSATKKNSRKFVKKFPVGEICQKTTQYFM